MAVLWSNALKLIKSPKAIIGLIVVLCAGVLWWYVDSLKDDIDSLTQERNTALEEKGRITAERNQLQSDLVSSSERLYYLSEQVKEAQRISLEREQRRQELDQQNATLQSQINELRENDETVDDYLNSPIPDSLFKCLSERTRNADGNSGCQ